MQMTTKADASIALGLGLTNKYNLACSFCYRDPTRADRWEVAISRHRCLRKNARQIRRVRLA